MPGVRQRAPHDLQRHVAVLSDGDAKCLVPLDERLPRAMERIGVERAFQFEAELNQIGTRIGAAVKEQSLLHRRKRLDFVEIGITPGESVEPCLRQSRRRKIGGRIADRRRCCAVRNKAAQS